MMTRAFACYNKNMDIRRQSSSGGIYYLLAEEIIRNGGVIYGACYKGTEVKHRRIEDEKEILASCRSKYVASDLGDTFMRVRKDLDEGRTVLFAGTPCQCEGILAFAWGVEEKLYCVDFVCHGIPSKKAWRSYISALGTRGFDMSAADMRDKCSGWRQYSFRLKSADGNEKVELHYKNPYMKGFLADLYLRPACYECSFKGLERKTDITLGDYWGVWDIQAEMDDNMGTSLVLVHSEKGAELFQRISEYIISADALLEEAVRRNSPVVRPVKLPQGRNAFFERIAAGQDFITVVESMTKVSVMKRVKRRVRHILSRLKFSHAWYISLRKAFASQSRKQYDRDVRGEGDTDDFLFLRKEECCGCTACYAVCPKHAITILEDEEGFDYPHIDETKCVQCLKCVKVCPIKAGKEMMDNL